MIKKFAIALFALASMAFSANAQLYVGGTLGLVNNNSKEVDKDNKTELNPSVTGLSLSPEVGFFLSDNFAVGLYINSSFGFVNNRAETPVKVRTTSFGLAPYARWYAVKGEKLGLFLEGQLGWSLETGKTISGDVTVASPKTNIFGVTIVPGISYDVTENVQLQMHINALGAEFAHSVKKNADGENEVNNNCGLTMTTKVGSAQELLNVVSVGFIYKF